MKRRWPSEIRLVAFATAFVGLSWVVVWRLGQLQIQKHEHYSEVAQGQHFKKIVIQPERGEIVDAKGRILATSVGRLSVYVDPRNLPNEAEAWAGLFSETLEIPYTRVISLLQKEHPVPLARRLPPDVACKMLAISDEYDLPENALWFHRETQRLYPRDTASHVIGFCSTDGDGDNVGMAGVESEYNEVLKGERVSLRLERSAIRTVLSPAQESAFRQAQGDTLVLTIDAAVQETAEQALTAQVEKYEADAGVVVVMETKTGAIRALCSYPGFDNNRFSQATAPERRNRVLTDPIEPGSVAKIFTMATLFELNRYGPNDTIDCHGGYVRIHGRNVTDAPGHTLHIAAIREVFRYSSNVGTVLAAQSLEPEEYYNQLRRYGFGRPVGIDLPGEGAGMLWPVEKWTAMSMSSLPMGYEIAMTPLQLVSAASGILNNGKLMRPYVVAERRSPRGSVVWRANPEMIREVVRPSTSALMRELMEEVVLHGTGKKAQVENYRTGGKTGTTRKSQVLDRREYISSFMGAVPIDDPELTIFCSIDNPKGAYYASEVAAPVFQEVATAALAQLAIPPTVAPSTSIASREADDNRHAEADGDLDIGTPDRMTTGPGEMPDLSGLTMAEARRGLRGFDVDVRFVGSGKVVDQSPNPGTPLAAGARAIVVFRDARTAGEEAIGDLEDLEAPESAPEPAGEKTTRAGSEHMQTLEYASGGTSVP